MRALLCLVSLLTACSDKVVHQTNGPADLSIPATAMPPCLPSPYTLLPFVTDVASHSFTQADPSLIAGKDYIATIETDIGCMAIDLLEQQTPITTNSFVFLALRHYFDGIAFHRVIDGFMAQTGDPNTLSSQTSTWGVGGPGYEFGLEVVPSLNYDTAGVVGMARTNDPNSNGSQFFITLAAASNLDQQYTIFGKVIAGLDVLPNVVRGEPPSTPTRMVRVSIAIK